MKFNKLLLFLLLIGFIAFSSCFSPADAAPARTAKTGVASFTPTGRVANNVAFKTIFTEAVVSRDDIGRILSTTEFPFSVSPAIQAEGKWLDERTFSASLLAPLDMGTVYTATVRDDLTSLKGKNIGTGGKFTFQTEALSLSSVRAVGIRNGEVSIQFDFNMPISPARLRGFLHIVRENGVSLNYSTTGERPTLNPRVSVYIDNLSGPTKLNIRIAAGLTGETGTLGLSGDVARSLEVRPILNVENLMPENSGVRVSTNFSVDMDRVADFVKVEPEIPLQVTSYYGGVFYIRGDFPPRQRFVFTFKKGLPGEQNGIVLEADHVQSVIMPDLEPSINLPSAGLFLSPAGGGRIPVELVNVNRMQLGLWRLYENNIPYVVRGDYTNFDRDLAKRMFNKELRLSLPLNETARRSIPLEEMLSGDRGLFMLTLSNPDYEYWYERSQIVNLSDMGAVVRLWEDGAMVWVNTLSTLEPVSNADVRVYSSANQIIAEGKTDADGLWILRRNEVWNAESDMVPALVTVSRNNDITFVRLTRGLMSQGIFDTSGRPWLRSGYDAVLFSARDIYRTGEQAPFKAIVRNYDLTTPDPFPVLFVVRDPLGRVTRRGTELLSAEGGAVFNLDIPGNALTGAWSLALYIPGNENNALSQMTFHVEDFAPPRIEVKLNSDTNILKPDETATLGISARYLFGVDGAGLKWEAVWKAWAGSFVPRDPKWKPYTFGDPARVFSPTGDSLGEGNLDETGNASLELALPDDWSAPSVINVLVTGRVMEESGRWISESLTLPYYPSPYLLGIAAPEGTLPVGKDLTFSLAAVTPEEEPAEPGELTATLYRVTWNYNLVRLDGYTRWQSTEEYNKIDSKTVSISNGVGEVTFKPERWGAYLVRVADETDNARASIRFYATDPEYADRGGSQLLDRVEIETDKELYQVGDVAKITLRAPFEGLLLFNVEAEGLIDRKIVSIDKAETVIEVPITEKMVPNAWCAAWLLRPLTGEGVDTTHRASGVKRIAVDTGRFSLSVKLEAPEKIEPATKLPVTVTLTDAEGKPASGEFAIALVDDGVLGLTGYRAPNPLNHFLGFRMMNSDGYDVYDQLMPIESRNTELLHPAGGAAMAAFAGASKAQRFKILSLFDGTVAVGDSGTVSMTLDLPEFSGRGRLFVVAVSGSRFGSAEQNVQIAREIVTEADLPRFVAPGDVFNAPLTIYNSGEESRDVTVEPVASGELSVHAVALRAIVPAKGSQKWMVKFTAGKPGTATYTVKTFWKEGDSEKSSVQNIDLPVRSPFPVITLSGSGIFQNGTTKIEVSQDFFSGKVLGKLTLADTPLVDLTKATAFLTYYPYGCLEQTISTAWPFLILPDALSEIDPLLVNSDAVKRKTDAALGRIQAMQLYDGSFAGWPGGGYPYAWGSIYAAHFLVEARKAGVDYPPEMLKGALNFLKQYLALMPGNTYKYQERDDFTTKAYAAYVLALNGEKPLGWLHYLKENKDRMWPSGRIWIAGAHALIEGRADALRELGTWSGRDAIPSEALFQTLDSNVRNTAQLLSIWCEVEPRSTEAIVLARMLLESGKQNRWYSTQENAAVTMALGRYLSKAGYEKGQLEGSLTDDDKQAIASFKSGTKVALDIADLPAGPWRLNLTGTGSGFYSWTLTGTPAQAPRPENRGLSMTCRWLDRNNNLIDRRLPLEQGTEVYAVLTLTPSASVSNLVVSYLLPAGMEIENMRLKGNESQGSEPWGVRYDIRDDRLLLFIDNLTEKTDYAFTMRAVTRGSFVVPPLAAEGMYDPGIHFIGAMEKNITIK